MKIPAARIELAASQEQSRYTLSAVNLDATNKQFAATDGHILAVISAEVSADDHNGLISLDTIKALRGLQKQAKRADVPVTTNGKVSAEFNGVKLEHEYATGTFPRYEMIKPAMEGPATISLDAGLLIRLAQALNAEATPKKAIVSLWIKDANSAVGVKVSSDPNAWGAIMPCASPKQK